MPELVERLRAHGVVPVIVIEKAEHAEPLAVALHEAGLPCAEITFRTPAAADALRRMRDTGLDLLLGAGTVLTRGQAAEAKAAGASFVVAPGFNPTVAGYCVENAIPIFPGVCTPSEIEAALELRLNTLKFFPAEAAGGLPFLKAVAAPYGDVQFIPTGGIGPQNLQRYLEFPRVVACGGSWMAPAEWIRGGEFDRIREATRNAVAMVRTVRGES